MDVHSHGPTYDDWLGLRTCPDCGGRGLILAKYEGQVYDCMLCNGTGEVSEEVHADAIAYHQESGELYA